MEDSDQDMDVVNTDAHLVVIWVWHGKGDGVVSE